MCENKQRDWNSTIINSGKMNSECECERSIELDVLWCKNIQSNDKSIRQAALSDLLAIVSGQTNDADLKGLFDQTYLYVIKCYADRFEATRSLAIAVVNEFLRGSETRNEAILDYIIPTMRRRIGLPELIESSEEIQLKLLEQLELMVDKFRSTQDDDDHLMRSYNDIIDIAARNLCNQYSNAHRQCCRVIQVLAVATPSFRMRAECLVDPLIEILSHRQSATRLIAIETLGVVCLSIDNKNDKLVKSIVSISPLLTDSVAAVRRMCGIVGCQWLMKLPDRYSFFERIIPLVLCCLKDDFEEIQNEIRGLFKKCGEKYFEENEQELQRIELVDDEFPCSNYTETISRERPTLGCRALVQRSLRMIGIMLNEMVDWKESVRLHSLKLLWEVVLYAEKAFTCKFMEVFPVLAKTCQDDERSVVKEAQRVALLMGQLLNYDDCMAHGMRLLEKYPNNLGVLRCFSSVFSGAETEHKSNSIESIAKLISTSDMCHNLNEIFQSALLDLIEQLIEIHLDKIETDSNSNSNEEQLIFEALVKTIAVSNAHENEPIANHGMNLYEKFCRTPENRTVLQGKYMENVINCIEDLDCEHTERSERIIMLFGCIKLCGFQIEYFDVLQSAIQMVLEHSNASAQIKILSGVSLAFLNWNHTNMEKNAMELLTSFVKGTIAPLLIWKAGRNSESIRTMATQTLYSISCACPAEVYEIYPQLAKQFIALVEDEVAVTRAYTLKCVLKSGPFCYEDYRQLTIDILSRLDDPCASVRGLAIECLAQIDVDRNDANYSETSCSDLAESVISRLFLYFDDPFVKLRPILLDTLAKLKIKHPISFEKEVNKLPNSYLYMNEINELRIKLCQLEE